MNRRTGGQYASDIRSSLSEDSMECICFLCRAQSPNNGQPPVCLNLTPNIRQCQTELFLLQVTEIPSQPGLNKRSEEDMYWLSRVESLGRVGPSGWAAFRFHTVFSELAFSLLFPIRHIDFIYSPIRSPDSCSVLASYFFRSMSNG